MSRVKQVLLFAVLFMSSVLSASESDLQQLEELRNGIENHTGETQTLLEYDAKLVQFKAQTADNLLKFRADYWRFLNCKLRYSISKSDTVKNELLLLVAAINREHALFRNDSRMVKINALSRQPIYSGDPSSERDFIAEYLRGDYKQTVFMPGSEISKSNLFGYFDAVLVMFEIEKINAEEIRKRDELFKQGKSTEEIRAAQTELNETHYLASKRVKEFLESIHAPPDAEHWATQSVEFTAKNITNESKSKLDQIISPKTTAPILTPESSSESGNNARPKSSKDFFVPAIACGIVFLAVLFMIIAHRKSKPQN